jgi:hypothetical protein
MERSWPLGVEAATFAEWRCAHDAPPQNRSPLPYSWAMAQTGARTSTPARSPLARCITATLGAALLSLAAACNTGPCKTGSEPVLSGGRCQCSDGTALALRDCRGLADATSPAENSTESRVVEAASGAQAESSDGGSSEQDAAPPADDSASHDAAADDDGGEETTSTDAGADEAASGDGDAPLLPLVPGMRKQVGALTFLLLNGCPESAVQVRDVPLASLPTPSGYDRYAGAYAIDVMGGGAPCLRVSFPLDPSEDDGPLEVRRDDVTTPLGVLEQTAERVTIAIDAGGLYTLLRRSHTVMLYDFESAKGTAAGDFQSDDSRPRTGRQSAHPLHLPSRGTSRMDFDCGEKAHTWLTFWYLAQSPAEGQALTFFIDDEPRLVVNADTARSAVYRRASFVVERGRHRYRLEANVDAPGQPPFWVDDIRCVDLDPQPSQDGTFDFEAGFVPPEMWGDFVIDDSKASSPQHAAHAPNRTEAGLWSMSLDCGAFSTRTLSFRYLAAPRSSTDVFRLYADERLAQTLPSTVDDAGVAWWRELTLPVPEGRHSYRWDANTSQGGPAPFWIDDVRCE